MFPWPGNLRAGTEQESHVGGCIGEGGLCCAEKQQHRLEKGEADGSHHNTADDEHRDDIAEDVLGFFIFALAESQGDQGAAADSDQHADGDADHEEGEGYGEAGEGEGAHCMADEDAVDDVI